MKILILILFKKFQYRLTQKATAIHTDIIMDSRGRISVFTRLKGYSKIHGWSIANIVLFFANSTLLVDIIKEITTENQMINSRYPYPDPGSNRDGLLQRCLRPSRLPIPPSGQIYISSVINDCRAILCKTKCDSHHKNIYPCP